MLHRRYIHIYAHIISMAVVLLNWYLLIVRIKVFT